MRICELRNLHLVTYENGMHLQQKLVSLRQSDAIPDQLLLLEHPPVITLGRGGDPTNLLASPDVLRANGIRFYETTRGGDITYHGPGQIVGYPIIHLGEGNRDIRKYVTKLEEVLIRTVAQYGITAARAQGKRGIWVGNNKIAAIGVRISRWVTSHGFALNVNTNLEHFRMILPCGIQGAGVTSIGREVGRAVSIDEVRAVLVKKFAEIFEREMVPVPATIRLVKVMVHDAGYVGFAARQRIVDLVGLKTPSSLEPHRELTWKSCGAGRGTAIEPAGLHVLAPVRSIASAVLVGASSPPTTRILPASYMAADP